MIPSQPDPGGADPPLESTPRAHLRRPERPPSIVIRGDRTPWLKAAQEVWEYRELLLFLVWRDLKVRYKQTALGAAWAVLQPLAAMVLFTIFFGRLAKMPSEGYPYPLFVFTALLPWTFFANAVTSASSSLVTESRLVSKVYFPRVFIPLAPIGTGLVDLAIGLGVLGLLLARYEVGVGVEVLLLPLLALFACAAAFSVGLILAALTVAYRDFRYVVPVLIQLWLFATPVIYPASIVPVEFQPLLGLNPMAGVVEGFRGVVLGAPVSGLIVAEGVLVTAALLLVGMAYFRRVERHFADII